MSLTRILSVAKAPVSLIVLLLSCGTARADFFIFNASTNPMTGQYLQLGSGHYNYVGAGETFSGASESDTTATYGTTGIEFGYFFFSQGLVPEDPSSLLPCVSISVGSGFCFNTSNFSSASDGTPVATGVLGLGIYDNSGHPLAFMSPGCGPDAVCEMNFFAGVGGAPINLVAQPSWLQTDIALSPRIVATGGLQDAIDAHFYDGSVDSFEFILSTPEPSSVLLFATLLFGIAVIARWKQALHNHN
jgi:hypothetical protein